VTPRPLPLLDERNRTYWTSGAEGVLRIQRCADCEHLVHPPAVLCPHDHGDRLEWRTVAGTGRVAAWTENVQSWGLGLDAPYLVALVELDEDPSARLLTNLVDVDTDTVEVGMPVRVVFEEAVADDGEVLHLPQFTAVDR
jgi:uncharacterized OB-fold protein